MKKNFFKTISCGLILSTVMLFSGDIKLVNAKTITEDNAIIETINVENLKESTQKISNTITITKTNIVFDKDKAFNEGFTSEEVERLSSIYDEMNQMIKDNKASIVKTKNNSYDIKMNNRINNNIKSNDGIKDTNSNTKSIITPMWYGYEFYFSARECGDAAAILAGAAATVAAVAGVLGLTGHIPAAIVTTVAAGVLGLGSAYLWYCSNCNGLNARYNKITGVSFDRNENC